MFTLLRTLSFGYLRQRWTRTLLLLASIALGVATLVATRALHDALKKSARDVVSPMTGLADLVVVNGQSGLPREVLAKLHTPALPGVAEVLPVVIGRAALPDLNNAQAWVLGLDIDSAQAGSLRESSGRLDAEIAWVEPPDSPAFAARFFGILLDGQAPGLITGPIAEKTTLDKPLLLRCAGHEIRIGVLGRIKLKAELSVLGENVVFTTLDGAARMATPDRPATLSQVNVRVKPGTDKTKVRAALQERVGTLGTVQTAEENFAQYVDIAAGLELGFLLGSAGALVVGIFLIYNVLSVGVAERRHDIGVLRSVGATRGQIAALFVAEAFILGTIGSLIGLPVGYAGARLALAPLGELISEMYIAVDPRNLEFSFWTFGLALLAGIGATVIAALVPAMQAAREEPADAVRRVPQRIGWWMRVVHVLSVLLLLGGGLACTILREQLPIRFGAFAGIVFILVGLLVATPMAAEGLGRLLQPLTRHLLGLEGRLAADNLLRTPGRTGLVIAALAATTAMFVQTAGFIQSSKIAVLGWIETSIAADLFVTSGEPVTKLGVTLPMSTAMGTRIAAVPGVAAAVAIRFHRVDFRNRLVLLLAVDLQALRGTNLKHTPARDVDSSPWLLVPGKASVSENFALLFGIKPGDTLTIPGPKGDLKLEVGGTYVDYSWNRGTILVNQTWFHEQFGDKVADLFDVYLKPQADEATVRAALLAEWGKTDALFATPQDVFKREVAQQVDRVYVFAYAQQAVIGVVALLGVVSSLLISVLQRRRELGLLRAVGASRSQILRSVLAEAGLMGVIGAVIGVLVGLVLEWYVLHVLILDEAGILFPMTIPWAQVGLVALVAMALPLLVGIWPAWQATRLRIADAIAYE